MRQTTPQFTSAGADGKDETGHNVILNIYPIAAEGTRYSEEFAAFLKGSAGYDSGDFETLGPILSD